MDKYAMQSEPERCVKSKIKQLCCGDEFSGHGKPGMPEPLALAQVLTGKHIKGDARDRIG
ncbi:hypothetical protein EO98_05165 [Methanosarcina sp. 2.H.T.1A.6]|uniref:hypothetical protein n=1 Tax=unclassified Methanosarcina TaxID=2644672 RepID=UPI000620F7D5|nr:MULTISPECIES: hypothetical protein [unclassified Methanosarcina]KKG15450.1 hypothetical protein EO94_00320 [Methanosarcina sp. 2.H.T.1A.3]KKG15745.1 hypothetical protein EO97_18115 [Methanosarcina sp. 2.H.T.1A.15]KKG24799.1 hypothetical protein EO98_05165 [Methanosarcina sp. 2.H.T.1A.6]KKG26084.1 hypothetical protein EO96_16430 [Methanosarcina sp. 2.H.T.1A.8]